MKETEFRLYVTGKTPRSQRAIRNLKAACREYLANNFRLEVIDVLEQPDQAEREKILQTPTLIKLTPPPVRRIIGDLSDRGKLLEGLDIESTHLAAESREEKQS